MIVIDQAVLRDFMWERIQEDHGPNSVLFGWAREGKLVSCISYSRFSETSCEAGIYSEGFFPRKLLEVALRYTFGQLGLTRLTFCCKSTNLAAINLNSALGAELEATLTGTYADADTLIWCLRPSKCPFWSKVNGKQRQGASSSKLRATDPDSVG